jgi:hypothetical protein
MRRWERLDECDFNIAALRRPTPGRFPANPAKKCSRKSWRDPDRIHCNHWARKILLSCQVFEVFHGKRAYGFQYEFVQHQRFALFAMINSTLQTIHDYAKSIA